MHVVDKIGPKHRMCRRVGAPLCGRPNCPANKRPYPPGQHGRGRKRISEYQTRLVEKQKMRAIYAVGERQMRKYYERDRPIELRPLEFDRYLGKKSETGEFNVWIRTTGPLPDDPAIHRCVLAYASDMMLLDTALVRHGRSLFERSFMAASLDHAMWFHRPFRADEWLLYDCWSPSLHGARGFARGLIFAADGTLVASVAQEGLLRERRPEG